MAYRTKTYIAGDWTGDEDLIQQIYKWNDSNYWALHFVDAHDLTQSRDSSFPCTIKHSLAERLAVSKTFVLIVGSQTDSLTKGSCRYCCSYNSWTHSCSRGHWTDNRSFIQYECEKAERDGLRIVVVYNYSTVHRDKCPAVIRYKGTHINGYYWDENLKQQWEYTKIKKAIMGL